MAAELEVAIKAATEAGGILARKYGRSKVRYKADRSVVTSADLESERRIRSVLKASFPEDSYLGEEAGLKAGSSGRTWVIDPLDGSTNYSIRNPFFSVSIALIASGETLLGVVYYPCQDELFYAEKGSGARLGGKRLRVSSSASIGNSTITFCHGNDPASVRAISKAYGKLKGVTSRVRQLGAASLELCFTACGRVDAFFMVGVKSWDGAAGTLLVDEAGGKVTDLSGKRFLQSSTTLLASNGRIHGRLLGLLSAR
ncbi:MAG: inositol monophosphatase [Candidatus Brockarchaeota archaeon]|nr:inositol monophosphatase [Candidatus Brockarchaeota archaeon]